MPKLRAARTVEEAALIPANEPVTIELTDPPPEIVKAEGDPTITAGSSGAALRTDPEPSEETSALRKQLDDLQKAEALSRQQTAEAQRREQEAIQLVNQHAERTATAEAAQEVSLYNETVNALSAAQADADKAQTDYAVAMEAQDYTAAAEAQRRMSTATSWITRYESDKTYLERRAEALKNAPKQEPKRQQQQLTVDQHIDQMNQLSPQQKSWLKQHPDALTDPVKNQGLGWAHHKAVGAGFAPNSDEYFAALETELGYRKTEADPVVERKGTNTMPVQAPVQRSAPSMSNGGSVSPTRVELTPEQREHARISGVDEVTYARNYLRLQQLKQQGHYNEAR